MDGQTPTPRATIIEKTIEFVKEALKDQESGHAFDHVERVWKMAKTLAQKEGITDDTQTLVIELGALLHDVADHKFHGGDEEIGPKVTRDFLSAQGFIFGAPDVIDRVAGIVRNISYKGANVANSVADIEGLIVQDADRLDAIGAIGIARTFSYGGHKNRKMYDPNEAPVLHATAEAYKKSQSCTINHFHEKLLLLKDRMNTNAGREIAQKRHQLMVDYVNNFMLEWEGKA